MLKSYNENGGTVCEGWILKKRRKKMQGFARRYFTLHQSGILSYSLEPGSPIRDRISLQHAAISTASGRKDIHVDSNTATFHLKCLSIEDFNAWMTAFRKFISLGLETRRSASMRLTSRHASVNFNKSGIIAEEMASTIALLEEHILLMLKDSSISPKTHQNSIKKKSGKEKLREPSKESKFGLFKRPSHQASLQEFGTEHSEAIMDNFPPSVLRIFSTLDVLKSQHAALLNAIQTFMDSTQPNQGSPLPATVEEEERPEASDVHPRLTTPLSRRSKHSSVATTISDSVQEWFDALDGPEEFSMDIQTTPEENDPPSRMLSNESRSSIAHFSVDSDIEEYDDMTHQVSSKVNLVSAQPASQTSPRRTQLPAPPISDEGSLFAILKKNVGKDLSTVTLPVTFNEPLTLLQRVAEEVEYYSVLDDAVRSEDPIDRLCYVAAFAVSGYAHTRHRTGRKGFNPMLGETFEDHRLKFIAEKVRHNPLEIAYYAEGDGWKLNATSSGKTKFWGKSLEIIPLGSTYLKIREDHYVWNKPSSFIRNLMVGTKYLEHSGKMTIENTSNHMYCVLDFKQNGYWGPSNVVSGTIYGSSAEVLGHLEGKWDDQMAQTLDASNFRILWRMTPFPKNTHDYYGFTSFGITLNELTDDLVGKLPPTDSRHRPDVRALENGKLELAEAEKIRVEEMQRERRRQGKDRQPRWFRQHGNEWVYSGGYWESRAQNWKGEEIHSLW